MEEDSTQPSTYPLDTANRTRSSNNLSPADELDIICLLRPCSRAAFDIAEKVARNSPEHVLHSGEIPQRYRKVIEIAEEVEYRSRPSPVESGPEVTPDLADIDMDYSENGVADIALRLSSRVIDMDMGFVFGRDARKCDIVLQVEDRSAARISGMHFRIFLNDNGMIMLEDTSTNGTLVDNFLLKHKLPVPGNSVRRIIQKGSIVAVFVKSDKTTARFIVDIPQRHDEAAWRDKLERYVSDVKRARHRKMRMLKTLGNDKKAVPRATHPMDDLRQLVARPSDDSQPADNLFITAGTTPWNHGMRWSGGGQFNVVTKLGSGAFATVYKLVDVNTGDELAAKEIEKRRFMKDGVLDRKITSELDILKRLKHPHVIEFFDHVDTQRDLYILMELVPYGDLSNHVGTSDKLSDNDMRMVAKQMCQALAYLHDNGIAHRDIKPENIIKKKIKPLWIKLADFGLSKIITQDDHHTAYQTFCGTLLYCAPEVYPGFAFKRAGLPPDPRTTKPSPYSTAVDIWSLAAVLFHLLCGKPPYEASAANHGVHMLDTIFEERFPRAKFDDANVHSDWDLFFENSLQLTAQQRWSARRLLKMPWMMRVSDVARVDYIFQNPDKDFALEEESSDEEMAEIDSVYEGGEFNMPIASQLSLNQDPASDEDDLEEGGLAYRSESDMTSLDKPQQSLNGLGIDMISRQQSNDLNQAGSGSSHKLRLRSDHTPPKDDGSHHADPVKPNSPVERRPGRLFGEITDSNIFGAAMPAPRFVDAATANPSVRTSSRIAGEHSIFFSGSQTGTKHQLVNRETERDALASPKRSKYQSANREDLISDDESAWTSPSLRAVPATPSIQEALSNTRIPTREVLDTLAAAVVQSGPSAALLQGNSTVRDRASINFKIESVQLSSNVNEPVLHSLPDTSKPQSGQHLTRSSLTRASSGPPSPVNTFGNATPALGVLTPSRRSIAVDSITITSRQTQYGRATECTHRYPDHLDTRISKSAFTILLHDPNGEDLEAGKDWTKVRFYAMIGTRCSGHIQINNIPMTRNRTNDEENMQLGLIQTGDVIEVFDKGDQHLRFHVQFWFGAAKEKRDNRRNPFRVLLGQRAVKRAIAEHEMNISNYTTNTT